MFILLVWTSQKVIKWEKKDYAVYQPRTLLHLQIFTGFFLYLQIGLPSFLCTESKSPTQVPANLLDSFPSVLLSYLAAGIIKRKEKGRKGNGEGRRSHIHYSTSWKSTCSVTFCNAVLNCLLKSNLNTLFFNLYSPYITLISHTVKMSSQ